MKTLNRLSIILAVALLPLSVSAQSVTEVMEYGYGGQGYGARALAMGQAFVPIADDYSALYWNPAGLGQISKGNFYIEASGSQFQNGASFQNQFLTGDKTFINIKALGFVLPFPVNRGSFVLAGGYQQRKDFNNYLMFSGMNSQSNSLGWIVGDDDTFYPFDSNVQQTERVFTEGGLGEYTLGGSVAVSPNLLLGASLYYRNGDYKYAFNFFQEDVLNNYNAYPGNFSSYSLHQEINAKIEGWSAKFGAMLRLLDYIRIGATVEIPNTFQISEEYSENDKLTYDDGYSDETRYEPGSWDYEISYPWKYSAGVALVTNYWTLSASADYTDISQARYAVPDGQNLSMDNLDLLAENHQIAKSFRPHRSLQAGFQLQPSDDWPILRTGYRILESPLQNSSANDTRKMVTAGLEFNLGNGMAIISSYTFEVWRQNSADNLTRGIVNENITNQNAYIGLEIGF